MTCPAEPIGLRSGSEDMALAKVKLNRPWKTHQAGEVIECRWADAQSLVADGAAEYVPEVPAKPKAVAKPPKDKMVRKTKNK